MDLEIHPDEPQIVRFTFTSFAEIEEARRCLAMSSGPCTIEVQEPKPPTKPRVTIPLHKGKRPAGKKRKQA